MKSHATATFKVRSWDEKPYNDSPKLTRASRREDVRNGIDRNQESDSLRWNPHCHHQRGNDEQPPVRNTGYAKAGQDPCQRDDQQLRGCKVHAVEVREEERRHNPDRRCS